MKMDLTCILKTALVAVALFTLGIFAFFCEPFVSDLVQRRQFDSAAWKAATWKTSAGENNQIRVRMVDDLLKRHHLIGMSRSQIVELLGAPNPLESKQTESQYVYYLGDERGFICIDSEWLVLEFQKDRVVSAKNLTD